LKKRLDKPIESLLKKLLIRIQNTQKCGVIIKKALAFHFKKKLN
jgi:hypothetical protein